MPILRCIGSTFCVEFWRHKPQWDGPQDGCVIFACSTKFQRDWKLTSIMQRLYELYSYFEMYLRFGLTQVDEIKPRTTVHVVCPTQPIPCLLILWRLSEPVHQQAWYWHQGRIIPPPPSEVFDEVLTSNCMTTLHTFYRTLCLFFERNMYVSMYWPNWYRAVKVPLIIICMSEDYSSI